MQLCIYVRSYGYKYTRFTNPTTYNENVYKSYPQHYVIVPSNGMQKLLGMCMLFSK